MMVAIIIIIRGADFLFLFCFLFIIILEVGGGGGLFFFGFGAGLALVSLRYLIPVAQWQCPYASGGSGGSQLFDEEYRYP